MSSTPSHSGRLWGAALAMAGTLVVAHGVFVLWQTPPGSLASPLGRQLLALACGAALGTAGLLLPFWWLGRRLHPAWKQGDRITASWSVALSLAGVVVGWMAWDRLLPSSAWIDERIAPWLVVGLALVVGCLPWSWPLPSKPLRRALQILALAGLLPLLFLPRSQGDRDLPKVRPWDGSARPDIVLVTVDTLRADRLAAYGPQSDSEPTLTPQLDRAAGEGVTFLRPLASSPWTMPSIASLMTSVTPLEHGAGLPQAPGPTFLRSPLGSDFEVLAERLRKAGYRTKAVVNNAFLSPDRGFGQGFETYETPLLDSIRSAFIDDVPLGRLVLHFLPVESLGDPRAAAVTDRALEWLDEPGDAPLFLWLHYIDPHAPYRARPEELRRVDMLAELEGSPRAADDGTVVGDFFVAAHWIRGGLVWLGMEDRERLVQFYDGAVAYTDTHVGRLFDALRQRQQRRPTVVAFTADHGEEFWDHGRFEHGHDYYNEVTRVPLFFWGPGIIPAQRQVDEPVGLVDVAPTLLELAELPVPVADGWDDGLSLVPGWTEESFDLPPRDAGGNLYNHPAVLVEDGPWRAILRAHGQLELYHVPSDPLERRDVAFLQPETAQIYRKLLQPRLDAFLRAAGDDGSSLSQQDLEGLRSLGYVQ